MKKVSFEQLKNLEISESLMESVLNVPNEKKQKPFLLRYYQYTIGFAAALVIAVGVSMYLFFGLGGNSRVNIPSLSPQSTAQAEQTDVAGESGTAVSSLPALDDKQSSTAQIITEPAETDGNIGGNSAKAEQQATTPTSGSKKAKAQNETKPNISGAEQKATEAEKTVPATGKVGEYTTAVQVENPTFPQASTAFPARCILSCKIDAELLDGVAYCKLVCEDATVLGSNNLFDSTHIAEVKDSGSGKVTLTYYVDSSDVKAADGKMYYVVFYDGRGAVLKRSTKVYLLDDMYFYFS